MDVDLHVRGCVRACVRDESIQVKEKKESREVKAFSTSLKCLIDSDQCPKRRTKKKQEIPRVTRDSEGIDELR